MLNIRDYRQDMLVAHDRVTQKLHEQIVAQKAAWEKMLADPETDEETRRVIGDTDLDTIEEHASEFYDQWREAIVKSHSKGELFKAFQHTLGYCLARTVLQIQSPIVYQRLAYMVECFADEYQTILLEKDEAIGLEQEELAATLGRFGSYAHQCTKTIDAANFMVKQINPMRYKDDDSIPRSYAALALAKFHTVNGLSPSEQEQYELSDQDWKWIFHQAREDFAYFVGQYLPEKEFTRAVGVQILPLIVRAHLGAIKQRYGEIPSDQPLSGLLTDMGLIEDACKLLHPVFKAHPMLNSDFEEYIKASAQLDRAIELGGHPEALHVVGSKPVEEDERKFQTATVPSDPLLPEAVVNALDRLRREVKNDLRIMKKHKLSVEQVIADLGPMLPQHTEPSALLNIRGRKEKVKYIDPQALKDSYYKFHSDCYALIKSIGYARNAHEQASALNQAMYNSFGAVIEDNTRMRPHRIMARFVQLLEEEYKALCVEKGGDRPINRRAQETFDESFKMVRMFAEMSDQAYRDLSHMTQAIQPTTLNELPQRTPGDLALMRLIHAGVPDDPLRAQSQLDVFSSNVLKQVFAPFEDAFPQKYSVITAWFVGRALDVIKRDDVKLHAQKVTPKKGWVNILEHPVNDNDPVPSDIELLRSPVIQKRICAMLKPIFEKPECMAVANDIRALQAALLAFEEEYALASGQMKNQR